MKRKFKKIISTLLIMGILVINMSYCVFAAINPNSPLGKAIDAYERTYDNIHNLNMTGTQLDDYLRTLAGPLGLIVGTSVYGHEALAVLLRGKTIDGETIPDNATDDEVYNKATEILTRNITVVSDNMIYNDASRSIVNYYYQALQEEAGKYYNVYTLDLERYAFSGMWTQELKDLILRYQDDYWVIMGSTGGSQSQWKYFFIKKDKVAVVLNSLQENTTKGKIYNNITFSDSLSEEDDSFYYTKPYNGSISVKNPYSPPNRLNFVPSTGSSNLEYAIWVNVNKQYISSEIGIGPSGTTFYCVSYGKRFPLIMYNSVGLMSSVLRNEAPYYTNSNWSNFLNGSGNYTVDTSNSNNITYGDVVTYNNNYVDDNGKMPSMGDINIYIDNNIPEAGGSGGGTGGGSGGGSGGSGNDGPTFDLGFLGTIGNLIGSLISGIGNLITGILQGIVNAFNSILEFLTDTIQDVGQNLPEQFFAFIGAMFDWLPEPMLNAFKALFLMMLFLGIFNLIKR